MLQTSEYNDYLKITQDNLTRDPSKFWSYVASKKKTTGYPNTMSHNNVESSSAFGICELFAKFFKDVYVADSIPEVIVNAGSLVDVQSISEIVSLGSIYLSRDVILQSLQSINVNKGSGPDDIPPSS